MAVMLGRHGTKSRPGDQGGSSLLSDRAKVPNGEDGGYGAAMLNAVLLWRMLNEPLSI
jgi:hypothetical protein